MSGDHWQASGGRGRGQICGPCDEAWPCAVLRLDADERRSAASADPMAEAAAMLRELEWEFDDVWQEDSYCPACGNGEKVGHDEICALAIVLSALDVALAARPSSTTREGR